MKRSILGRCHPDGLRNDELKTPTRKLEAVQKCETPLLRGFVESSFAKLARIRLSFSLAPTSQVQPCSGRTSPAPPS